MPASSRLFRDPQPSEPRLSTDLPCHLWKDDVCTPARIRNINHSGVQVSLPPEVAEVSFRDLGFVTVEGIGAFDVVLKWQRDGRLGLKFADRVAARPLLDAWFRASGRFP